MREAEELCHLTDIDEVVEIYFATHNFESIHVDSVTPVDLSTYIDIRKLSGPGDAATSRGLARTLIGGSDMNERTRSYPLALSDIEARLTLSIDEVATVLGLGRTDAYEAARRGDIPSRRLGRRVIVPVPAFLEWLGAAPAEREVA